MNPVKVLIISIVILFQGIYVNPEMNVKLSMKFLFLEEYSRRAMY
jgi:hypothetical protein